MANSQETANSQGMKPLASLDLRVNLSGHPATLNVKRRKKMAQKDQLPTAIGANHVTLNAVEGAMNAVDATSKHKAVANEMFEMSKQSMDQATQTLDKLRGARFMDELMSIQSDYVKQVFAYFTQHSRRFGELFMGFPGEISKSYQDAWLHAVNAAVQATQVASQTAADSVKSYSDAAQKSSTAFENRNSA
jgi:hypothetical protein